MADIVTGTVTGQLDTSDLVRDHADIRREAQAIGGDIRREAAEDEGNLIDAIKTAGWANSDRTGTEADRVTAQDTAYFIAGQAQNYSNATALAGLKASTDANFSQTLSAIQLASANARAAAELSTERVGSAVALGQALLGQQIVADGNATRALMNGIQMDTMNRQLSERNAEIVENRGYGHYWHGQYANSQQANLVSQVNALNSQFQETRQGMVNFGTMAGVGQSSTSNNVR